MQIVITDKALLDKLGAQAVKLTHLELQITALMEMVEERDKRIAELEPTQPTKKMPPPTPLSRAQRRAKRT